MRLIIPRKHIQSGIIVAVACAASGAFGASCHAQTITRVGRVIHLVVQADPDMNAFEVGNKFVTARASTPGFNFEEHSVDPIAPESYRLLSSIIRSGRIASEAEADDATSVLVEPLKGQEGAWLVDLRDPAKFIDHAAVVVFDAEKRTDETLELDVAPRLQANAPLRFHSPGAYVLQLGKNKLPKSATLRVTVEQADGTLSQPTEVAVAWPDVGRCYLVTLKGVKGDEQRLFESLQDEQKVGNPIKELYASTATLIVGSFQEKSSWRRPGYVSLRYSRPANTNPKRLWMRFPMTESEAATVRAELDKQLEPADGFKKLPGWLDSRALKPGEKLVQGDERWIAIPWNEAERGFEREVPIDTRAWKSLLATSPDKVGDHAILVWEFENPANPNDREAIRVGGAGGKRYQSERLPWWLSGLPNAPLE
jgi:hypothetical protein